MSSKLLAFTTQPDEKKLKTQQARLLNILWKKHGSNRLAIKLGFSRSLLNAWKRNLGYVPLVHLGHVSRYLKVDRYLLNYEQMTELMGQHKHNFKEIVIDSELFDTYQMDYIFKGSAPCTKKLSVF